MKFFIDAALKSENNDDIKVNGKKNQTLRRAYDDSNEELDLNMSDDDDEDDSSESDSDDEDEENEDGENEKSLFFI